MLRIRAALSAAALILCVPGILAAGWWGIYDPYTHKTMDRSSGTYPCSGIADKENCPIKLKFYSKTGDFEEDKSGTTGTGFYAPWGITLNQVQNGVPFQWSLDPATPTTQRHTLNLYDVSGGGESLKHSTNPRVVQ